MTDLSKLTDEQLEAIYNDSNKQLQQMGYTPEQLNEEGLKNIAGHALKGLDYGRGAVQYGLLKAMGQENLLTPEEKAAALDITNKQMAPSWGDVFERKKGDFTGSQTSGFLTDIATDPLTYVPLGLPLELLGKAGKAAEGKLPKIIGKLAEMARGSAPGSLVNKAGEKIYRSPFRRADTEILEKLGPGNKKYSDIILEKGWTGDRVSIGQKMNDYLDNLAMQQSNVLQEAGKAGNRINLNEALAPAEEYAHQLLLKDNKEDAAAILKKVQSLKETANQSILPREAPVFNMKEPVAPTSNEQYLNPEKTNKYLKDLEVYNNQKKAYLDEIEKYKALENNEFIPLASPEQASGMKSEIWKSMPKNAYGETAVSDSRYAGLQTAAGGLAKSLEGMPGGYGIQLQAINPEMQTIFTGAPKEKLALRMESNRPMITGLDRNVGPIIAGTSDEAGTDLLKWATVKKVLDALMYGTTAPTKTGKFLMKPAVGRAADEGIRRGVIRSQQPKSPWIDLEKGDENGQ